MSQMHGMWKGCVSLWIPAIGHTAREKHHIGGLMAGIVEEYACNLPTEMDYQGLQQVLRAVQQVGVMVVRLVVGHRMSVAVWAVVWALVWAVVWALVWALVWATYASVLLDTSE